MRRIAWIIVAAAAAALMIIGLRIPLHRTVVTQSAKSAFGSSRLNILILGSQPEEGNSDTIIFAHFDLDRRTATLVSIPRDTWLAIPGHAHDKLTTAIGYGGPALSARLVAQLLHAPVDGTIVINPQGAKQLVDAMGGLNVNVERDMDYDDNYGNLHIHLTKGEHFLTGGQVLGYMRFRNDLESDWGRMRRQQQILRLIVKEMGSPSQWQKLPHLLDVAKRDVQTTLNDQQLAGLIDIYKSVPEDDIRTFTLPGRPTYVGPASVVLLDPRWAALVGEMVFAKRDPPQDLLLVANATGVPGWDKMVAGALRGGGWNVPTSIEQPMRPQSELIGTSRAAEELARIFTTLPRRGGGRTVLRIGADLAPIQG